MTDKHDDLRAKFEAWAKDQPFLEDDHGYVNLRYLGLHKQYVDATVEWAWRAYSAGQRAAAVRAAELCMEQAKEPECPERAAYCAASILRDAGIDKEQA